jgi:hypothetical protein
MGVSGIGTTPFTFVLRRDRVTKKRSNSLTSGILELLYRESDQRKIPAIRQHRAPVDTRRSGPTPAASSGTPVMEAASLKPVRDTNPCNVPDEDSSVGT